jgi:hypothetical protein
VTYNRDDFLQCTGDALVVRLPHAGVVILSRELPCDAARVAHALARWAEQAALTYEPQPQPYTLDFLS